MMPIITLFLPLQHYGYAKITADSSSLTWEFVRDEDSTTYDEIVLSRDVQQRSHNSKVKGRHSSVKGRHSSVKGRHSSVKGRHSSVKGRHSSVKGRHSSVKGRHFDRTPKDFHSKHTPDDEILEPYQDANEL